MSLCSGCSRSRSQMLCYKNLYPDSHKKCKLQFIWCSWDACREKHCICQVSEPCVLNVFRVCCIFTGRYLLVFGESDHLFQETKKAPYSALKSSIHLTKSNPSYCISLKLNFVSFYSQHDIANLIRSSLITTSYVSRTLINTYNNLQMVVLQLSV